MPEQDLILGDKARENWYRYQYCRDEGHLDFVKKKRQCENFFAGLQWDKKDLDSLRQSRRPAMTINKILSTVDHMVGEQLYNRSSFAYRPARGEATGQVADALTKVGMNISHANSLPWVRTDVFCDGIISSRGFFDVRIDLNTNFMGDVVVTREPSDNVLLDPDANEYDPDTWGDVMTSRWISGLDARLLFGDDVAEELLGIPENYSPYGDPGDDFIRTGTFGTASTGKRSRQTWHPYGADKHYRIIDRQHFERTVGEVFINIRLGEITPVPTSWDRDRISYYLEQNPDVFVLRKPIKKVRWTVSAGHITLHDKWSPYRHFTLVPFFPRLRDGRTIGVVEHLISPQEILNKSSSQELHILSTSANSGWIVQMNNLVNMTDAQLEEKGSQTGIVIVVKDKEGIEKIKPNQVPTGLDRISYKAEENMKTISGVSDYQTGFAREDVAAKAVQANQAVGGTSFAPLLDNLARTDVLLGKRILDLVQTFYVEPRLLHIIDSKPGAKTEQLMVNQPDPRTGQILNNLTLGEYGVIITNEPDRDTFEASQYDQLVEMRRDLGIPIPDSRIIRASKAREKEEIISEMQDKSPEQEQFEREVANRDLAAELRKKEAEAMDREADATLKTVRAAEVRMKLITEQTGDLSAEQLAEMKMSAFERQQESNLKLRELNYQFMLDLRRLREEARIEVQKVKALPKPQSQPSQ